MFIQDSDLKTQLHDVLQRATSSAGDLKPFWTSIIHAANLAAYWDILSAFLSRGYSKTLVDQWDRGSEFQTAFGIWWCLESGLSQDPGTYNEAALTEAKMDRRWEILGKEGRGGIPFTIGGKFVQADLQYGQIVTGAFDTSNDLVVMDMNDSRLGQVTRF